LLLRQDGIAQVAQARLHTHARTQVPTNVHQIARTCTLYIHICTYSCTHTHTHTNMHMHMHAHRPGLEWRQRARREWHAWGRGLVGRGQGLLPRSIWGRRLAQCGVWGRQGRGHG
jgi:hypothetical protein